MPGNLFFSFCVRKIHLELPTQMETDVGFRMLWQQCGGFEGEMVEADRPEGWNMPNPRGKGNEEILKSFSELHPLDLLCLGIRIIFMTGYVALQ